MKDPMPSADLVLDFLAKNIVVDEIAHVVVRVAVEVAAGVESSDCHKCSVSLDLARPLQCRTYIRLQCAFSHPLLCRAENFARWSREVDEDGIHTDPPCTAAANVRLHHFFLLAVATWQ